MFDRVTVRMYEMGFGDCFLVTFWKEKIGKSVLFDCGSLSRTKAEISKVAADVVASCMGDDGKPRIELVVCTHRHKDHVNGFDDAIWAKVEVGEVWMPWTENPRDAEATRIRERQSSFAFALCKSLDANFKPSDMPLADGRNDEVAASYGLNIPMGYAAAAKRSTGRKQMPTTHSVGPSRRRTKSSALCWRSP
jgi:beta-lactamase superfamily II metal-dependent hydrolase